MIDTTSGGTWKAGRGPVGPVDGQSIFRALVFGAILVLLTTVVLVLQWPLSGQYNLALGDVSPVDIRSPRYVAFISESLTEADRQAAERRVIEQFEPLPRARADQVRRARDIMAAISEVRGQGEAGTATAEQIAQFRQLPDIPLADEQWQAILQLDETGWERVAIQVPAVLNVIMLNEIRENQLETFRRNVPAYLDLVAENEALAAAALVRSLLRPNMVLNAERTEAARAEARNSVLPKTASYEENEIIIRQGDIVNARHIEALTALGLNQPRWDWWQLLQAFIVAVVLAGIFDVYLLKAAPRQILEPRQLGLLLALMATFLLLAKLMVPGHTLLQYIFPLAALPMLIYPLLGPAPTFLVVIYFGVVIAYLTNGLLPILVYSVTGPLIGALLLGRADRTGDFVRAGAVIAAISLAVLIAFNVPVEGQVGADYLQLLAAALANGGLAASISLIGFYLLGTIFDLTTPLRLMDLARPNHPLLSTLMTKAPGTYHHSLLVSNLAEQAAQAIGADAYLTRVGSYYHDIGKTNHPYFFVENRLEDTSPHDQLDPWSSAQIIINHVRDGMELARRHRLPRRIRDFIAEHQGTTLVRTFYSSAQEMAGAGQVNEADFRYPGPKPQSKETAILMLADSCESAVRAAHPESREQIDELVSKIIGQRLSEGELSQSDLTLRELETIREVFVRSLQGVHHPRIKYPEPEIPPLPVPSDEPTRQPASVN